MKYSVLIVGSDKNVRLLDLFFEYFFQFFDIKDFNVYLSLEKASYEYPNYEIAVFNDFSGLKWSGRVKKALKEIDSSAVFLLLDDFILERSANLDEIKRLADLIEVNESIAHFALTTVPMKNISDDVHFSLFYKRHPLGRYKTTLQAGIWNRLELMDLLNDNENAWQFEVFGNYRSYLSKREFYALSDKRLKPYEYNDGFFAIGGKMNEEEVKRLSIKFGKDLHVPGMESNNWNLVRDSRTLSARILQRLKMMLTKIYYLIKYWRK